MSEKEHTKLPAVRPQITVADTLVIQGEPGVVARDRGAAMTLAPYWQSADGRHTVCCGDALTVLRQLPAQQVQCCITSPPYWGLRRYIEDTAPEKVYELGLEPTPAAYVANLVAVFRELWRVLKDDGTLWVNAGDSYASGGREGHGIRVGYKQQTNRGMNGTHDAPRAPQPPGLKPKDLVGVPWRLAFALQDDGWWLRSEIIWHKPNPMPESVTDRPTKAHEQVFLLAKRERYYYDAEAIREEGAGRLDFGRMTRPEARLNEGGVWPNDNGFKLETGRNRRTVWTIPTHAFPGAHFATFPPPLVQPCLLAGCPPGGVVLDPFCGAGTVALVAIQEGRQSLSIELNPAYCALAVQRLEAELQQLALFPPAPAPGSAPRQERLL